MIRFFSAFHGKHYIRGQVKNRPNPCSSALRSLSGFDLKDLAKASQWSSREGSKLSPERFCSALLAASTDPNASLRTVAFLAGEANGPSVSKQAIQKRVNPESCLLLTGVLGQAVSRKSGDGQSARKLGFKRIILQDSTSITLPRHLLGAFKGPKHSRGEEAGLKIHTSYDLLARRFEGFEIREQRSADQGFALEGIEGLGEGDLLVRDLGYFKAGAFRQLALNGGHALTRWKPHTKLLDPENMDTIDLLALLRRSERVDREVLVADSERFPMRLVAFRVPEGVAAKRRRNVKETAKRKGRTASQRLLDLQDWEIFLTTCDPELLPQENLFELYAQRWAIEILFKGFKSHMRIASLPPRCSGSMALSLILSSLIAIVFATAVVLPRLELGAGVASTSILKLYSLVHCLGFTPDHRYLEDPARLENLIRHSRYEKRKRKSLPQRLEALG